MMIYCAVFLMISLPLFVSFLRLRSISGSNKTLSRSSYRIRSQFIITIKKTFSYVRYECGSFHAAQEPTSRSSSLETISFDSRKFNYSISSAQYSWSGYLKFQFPLTMERTTRNKITKIIFLMLSASWYRRGAGIFRLCFFAKII